MSKLKTIRLREKIRREDMEKIRMIERNYWLHKTRPKRINVPRFKEKFEAALIGWRTRR